ncbi:MAG: hypothetical protein HY689_07205 [Chloroflexi bacterium]|nr:hypothetical protein [Chloroflexota bacterium]
MIVRNNVSFVIRLWLEPRTGVGDPEWRSHVFHVQSGEEAYFRRLSDLLSFVERKSGVSPPS